MQQQCSEVEMEKRKLLLRDFQSGLTHSQARDNIVDQFGDCVGFGTETCRRWFVKFGKGNFDLNLRPRGTKYKEYIRSRKKKKVNNSVKPIKMGQEVPTIEKQVKDKAPVKQPPAAAMQVESEPNAPPKLAPECSTVQNLIQKKRELTISKVTRGAVIRKQAIEPNIITIAPSARKSNSPSTSTASTKLPPPVIPMEVDEPLREMPKLRPRRCRPQWAVRDMISKASPTPENQNIGSEAKKVLRNANQKLKNTEKEIIESQNLSPDVTTTSRNTVRTKSEAINKRHTLPKQQSNPNQITDKCIRMEPKEGPSTGGVLKIVNVANVETICSEIIKNTGRKIPEVINKLKTYSNLKPKNTKIGNYGMTSAEPMDVSGTGIKIANVANVQSIISEMNKTTGRKIPEIVNKRYTLPLPQPQQDPLALTTQSSLSNQKGVIYLNPQQIFRQKFGDYKKPLKSPSFGMKPAADPSLLTKITPFAQRQPTLPTTPAAAAAPSAARQEIVTLIDSEEESQDTDDDLIFPENISLPAPKVKALPETFATYWDLDNCKPISMDNDEPVAITLTKTAQPHIIEID